MTTTAIAIEAMNCRTLDVVKFGSYYAAKLEGFDPAAIRACIKGQRYTHGGFTWQAATRQSLGGTWCATSGETA